MGKVKDKMQPCLDEIVLCKEAVNRRVKLLKKDWQKHKRSIYVGSSIAMYLYTADALLENFLAKDPFPKTWQEYVIPVAAGLAAYGFHYVSEHDNRRNISRTKKEAIKDLRKIPGYFLPAAATMMIRSAKRYGLFTGLMSTVGYGTGNISGKKALLTTIGVVGGFLATGIAIKGWQMLSLGKVLSAEANNLNLMMDYRKARAEIHAQRLIDRVFMPESRLLYPQAERHADQDNFTEKSDWIKSQIESWPDDVKKDFLHIHSKNDLTDHVNALLYARPHSDKIEKCQDAWRRSIMHGLIYQHTKTKDEDPDRPEVDITNYYTQNAQEDAIGFPLGLVEDWRDGAYGANNDTKLKEQYSAKVILKEVKAGINYSSLEKLAQNVAGRSQKMWFAIISRSLAANVVQSMDYLNKKYETTRFDAQTILTPGAENESWLEKHEGAKEELLQQRKAAVQTVFGTEYEKAKIMIDHMFFADFRNAAEMIKYYDPEMCMKSGIEQNIVDDLKEEGCHPGYIEDMQECMDKTEHEMGYLDRFLHEKMPDMLNFENAEALRAVRIAYHIDKNGLKSNIMAREDKYVSSRFGHKVRSAVKRSNGDFESNMCGRIEGTMHDVISKKDKYTRRLNAVRVHYELTMIHIDEYQDLVKKLAYNEPKQEIVEPLVKPIAE